MSSEGDRLLIRDIRQGDPRAWESLIARYEGRLLAFVDRRLRDRSSSEDVVQETFIGFLNSLPHFDDKRELQTYLFTIASHKLTDHLRRKGRHPAHPASDGAGEVLQHQIDPHKAASSLARSHERRTLEAEAVAKCLGRIIRDWRERGELLRLKVLELLFVKGWANRDVAAFLNISEQQVANYRFAAVKKLTEYIREAGLPEDVFPELREDAE
jgi:RNA polymerase sigma-70 factor (ECF subfamily)